MKTKVESVFVLQSDGSRKRISMRTRDGHLKSVFLRRLFKDGAVAPGQARAMTLLVEELLDERNDLNKRHRAETAAATKKAEAEIQRLKLRLEATEDVISGKVPPEITEAVLRDEARKGNALGLLDYD